MARPKHHNPLDFTAGELSVGAGITIRNIQFLRDQRLGPFSAADQSSGLYSEDTLAELAMIAGCVLAGYSLLLASAIVSAFTQYNPNHSAARWCNLDSKGAGEARYERKDLASWFESYCKKRASGLPDCTSSFEDDYAVFIADRTYVLTGATIRPRLRVLVGEGVDPNGPFALGRMEGLNRGGEVQFRSVAENTNYEQDEIDRADIAYQTAARNACALSTVNLSLSIRHAFARVYAMRRDNGGPLWDVT